MVGKKVPKSYCGYHKKPYRIRLLGFAGAKGLEP
jgi:hypothetical protein